MTEWQFALWLVYIVGLVLLTPSALRLQTALGPQLPVPRWSIDLALAALLTTWPVTMIYGLLRLKFSPETTFTIFVLTTTFFLWWFT